MGAAVAAATALVVTEASTLEAATSAGYWLVPLEEGCSDNIEKLAEKFTSFDPDPGCRFVYDLLGNSTFRFKQFDGTIGLPYKEGVKFQLARDVTVCGTAFFKKIAESVLQS
jgi:hypothetical protein